MITDEVIDRVVGQVSDLIGDALDVDRASAHVTYRFRAARHAAKAYRVSKKAEARVFLAQAAVEAILGIASIDSDVQRRQTNR